MHGNFFWKSNGVDYDWARLLFWFHLRCSSVSLITIHEWRQSLFTYQPNWIEHNLRKSDNNRSNFRLTILIEITEIEKCNLVWLIEWYSDYSSYTARHSYLGVWEPCQRRIQKFGCHKIRTYSRYSFLNGCYIRYNWRTKVCYVITHEFHQWLSLLRLFRV